MAIIVHRWICFTILPYIIFLSDHQVLIFLFLSDGHVLFEATNPTIMVVAQHTSPTFSWNHYCTSNVGSGFGSCKISKRGYTRSHNGPGMFPSFMNNEFNSWHFQLVCNLHTISLILFLNLYFSQTLICWR